MSIQFDEALLLKPIPVSRQLMALQAALIQRRLSSVGSLDQIRAEALDAVYNTSHNDEPSEIKRLRLQYKEAYTRDELMLFIVSTLAEQGFSD